MEIFSGADVSSKCASRPQQPLQPASCCRQLAAPQPKCKRVLLHLCSTRRVLTAHLGKARHNSDLLEERRGGRGRPQPETGRSLNLSPGGMTVPPIGIDRLPSGLLEWPAATPRSEQLQLRATWEHVTTKLRDRVKLASSVWAAVMSIEGVADEVLTDIILRHVRAARQSVRMFRAVTPALPLCVCSLSVARAVRARTFDQLSLHTCCQCSSVSTTRSSSCVRASPSWRRADRRVGTRRNCGRSMVADDEAVARLYASQ